MNKFAGGIYHDFTHVRLKSQSYDVQFLRFGVGETKIFVTLGHFSPFYLPLMILNIKILKKMKKLPEDIILLYIHVYHKWRSYDIWFLKCKVWQTEIFDILGHFLLFQPLENLENQNFNIEKNTWRYYHFIHLHHKWQSYDIWFLRYATDIIFCHSRLFFCPFTPLCTQKIKIFKKMEKIPVDIIFINMDRMFCHFGPSFALLTT